jgi:hypothetical protein
MKKDKFICRLLFYLVVFPLLVNVISFLEVTFVDKEYLNNYFRYVKYVYSIIIIIDLMYSIKYYKWLPNWFILLVVLLIGFNYFYGCIILVLLYYFYQIEIKHTV